MKQFKQKPLTLRAGSKTDVRTQFAALCFRVKDGKVQILLITSLTSRRWIIPKGWPMDGKTPAECAAAEAWEEAGVEGKVFNQSVGVFSYHKDTDDDGELPVIALVYPIKVKSLARSYPERKQRRRKWFSRKKAASLVEEPDLAAILRNFDPRQVRGAA